MGLPDVGWGDRKNLHLTGSPIYDVHKEINLMFHDQLRVPMSDGADSTTLAECFDSTDEESHPHGSVTKLDNLGEHCEVWLRTKLLSGG